MFDKILGILGNGNPNPYKGRKILVIDDNPVQRKFMQATLGKAGYNVILAENAQEGFDAALREKPDIIYLDYSMPDANGVDVCKRIKEQEAIKNIPIVFLSASVAPVKIVDCYDVGGEYFLSKPITPETLLKHTRMLFEDVNDERKLGNDS